MSTVRSKLGGNRTLTRNQAQKAQRSGQQAERLHKVTQWANEWEEKKKEQIQENKAESKKKRSRKVDMRSSTKARRSRVLNSLLAQLEVGTKVLSTKGVTNIPYEIYSKLMEETATPELILPLNHTDVARIKKEIEILKLRGAIVIKPIIAL